MPLERRHARIPAAIALVVVAVFAVLWIGARTPFARGLVAGRISDVAGLPASIGKMRIGFFPSPTIEIEGLTVSQPAGFGEEPLLSVGRLVVRLPWRSVFGAGDLEAVAASDAIARLRVRADGTSNWSSPATAPAEPGSARAPAAPSGRTPAADWRLGAIDLERGAIDYHDAQADTGWQLTAIKVAAQEVAPGREFPLALSLGGVFGANTAHYAMKGQARIDTDAGRYEARGLDYRGWVGGEPLPLAGAELTGALSRASFDAATGLATLEGGRLEFAKVPASFDGRLDLDTPSAAGELRMTTAPFAPRVTAIILGKPLPVTTDPVAFETLQLALVLQLADGALRLEPVSGRLDDTNFEGRAVPGERFVRASLDRIDLNRYLPPAAETRSEKRETLEVAIAALTQLDLDAEFRIGEARVAGATMRDTVIRVDRSGGAP
jgi:hypothetical protein